MLDASKGNRTNEKSYNLSVDFSEIYKTNDIKEIRNIIATEIVMLKELDAYSPKKQEAIKEKALEFLNLSDTALKEARTAISEPIKTMWKPKFEVHQHFINADNSITIIYKENPSGKSFTNIIKFSTKNDSIISLIEDEIKILQKKIQTALEKSKTTSISHLKTKVEILTQVLNKIVL